MVSNNVQVIKSFKSPPQMGTHYRLLCMTGEDKGTSFFLKSKRAVMGRGDTVDIQVKDIKSSRDHAELTKLKETYVITDLGSQNGVMVNDLQINQHTLADGDKIIIGQTVYKYNIIEVKKMADDFDGNGDDAEEGQDEEDFDDDAISSKGEDEPPKKKKTMLYGGIAVAVLYLVLGGGGDNQPKSKKTKKGGDDIVDPFADDINKKNKKGDDRELKAQIGTIIHRGLREFREGNYFRAIEEFNMVLNLDPNNGRASFYKNKAQQSLDEFIKSMALKGAREMESLKYDSAQVTYCSVIRYLEGYEEDERYKAAENKIAIIEERIGLYPGDIKCIEK